MPHDILPGESSRWQAAERVFLDTVHLGGFREIRISQPDGTDFLAEAAVRNGLAGKGLPVKLCGFRDTPDGRQFCAAILGPPYPAAAAELISLAGDFFALLGLPEARLEIGPGGNEAALAARLDAMNLSCLPNPAIAPDCFAFFWKGQCLCTGGRQDGAPASAGFAISGDTLLAALAEQGVDLPAPEPCVLYIAPVGEAAEIAAAAMAADLRGEGFAAECGLMGLPLAEQLAHAGQIGARFTMALDESCLAAGQAQIRDTATGNMTQTGFGEEFPRFFNNWQIMELTGALEGYPLQLGEEE